MSDSAMFSAEWAWDLVDSLSSPPVPALQNDELPRFIEGLRRIFTLVTVHGRLSPEATRTRVQTILRKLSANRTPNAEILNDPLANEMMNKAWHDFRAVHPGRSDHDRRFETIQHAPRRLAALVRHLRLRLEEFDQMTHEEQLRWRVTGASKQETATRQMLFPFLSKGRTLSIDTETARLIADLYELTYKKRFAVTSIPRTPSNDHTARYQGPGIRFACTVLETLGLLPYFNYSKSKNINRRKGAARYLDPKLDRKRLLSIDDSPTPGLIANRIGDAWKNETQRKRKAPTLASISTALEAETPL